MAINDANRSRKTYPFFRATPVFAASTEVVVGDGLTISGDKNRITINRDNNPYVAQASWFIDQANGNDSNTGKLGSPLQSTEELARRLFPGGSRLMLQDDVTIYIASGTYLNSFFAAGCDTENVTSAGGRTMRIVCAQTYGNPILISSATLPSAPTVRGEIKTLTGSFTPKKKLRFISGPYSGSVCYSTGLASGSSDTYISGMVIPQTSSFHNFAGPTAGAIVQEETPQVLFRRMEVDAGPYAKIVIENAQIIRVDVNGCCHGTPSGDAGGNVTFSACDAAGQFSIWQCNSGGANLFGCRLTLATVFQGFGWLNWGSVVQGLMGISNGHMSSYGMTIDGGQLLTNVMANFEYKSVAGSSRFTAEQSYNGTGTIEVQNGGNAFGVGAAINVLSGGEFVNAGRQPTAAEIWGLTGSYAIGFNVTPGGHMYQLNVNSTGDELLNNFKIPSVINLKIGSSSYSYSKTERPDPNHNCGFLAGSYS